MQPVDINVVVNLWSTFAPPPFYTRVSEIMGGVLEILGPWLIIIRQDYARPGDDSH